MMSLIPVVVDLRRKIIENQKLGFFYMLNIKKEVDAQPPSPNSAKLRPAELGFLAYV